MSTAAVSPGAAAPAESPVQTGQSQGATLRVCLQSIAFDRTDGQLEDDVKTWAHCVMLTGGKPNGRFWYTNESELNFGKTSVRLSRE
jgi:hypothetical protein